MNGNTVIDWPKNRAKIIRWYRGGESTRRIAVRIGVSHSTVNKYLSEWGIQRRWSADLRGTGRKGRFAPDRTYDGVRLGRLTVLGRHPVLYPAKWMCLCDCGKRVNLREPQLSTWRSCGCRGRVKRGRRKKYESIRP